MSKLEQDYKTIDLSDLSDMSKKRKEEGWRFVQLLATTSDSGIDLVYSFMKKGKDDIYLLDNVEVKSINKDDEVPSITKEFIAAFVFENEVHDLYGVNIKDIAIDFNGSFYNVAVDEPMTIVSPEVIARKEKQKKIDAALAAKKAREAAKANVDTKEINKEKGE